MRPGDIKAARRKLVRVVGVTFVTLVAMSQLLELFISRVLFPSLEDWTWISEAFVIGALLVTTTLWARLRLARETIVDLERERLRVQAELGIAADVQRALLPPIPEPRHGLSWYAIMEPAGQVGGDYYDFFPLGDDRMCAVLADVSGKGVPAAVFMSNTRAVLRAVARRGVSPCALLTEVSQVLFQDGHGSLYVTCIVAIVDLVRHAMVYANAGHPAGVVVGPGHDRRALNVGGPPLGLLPDAQYHEERLSLDAGDLVVFVSDGVTDALDAGGDAIPAVLSAELADLPKPTPALACSRLVATARRSGGPQGVAGWADDRTVLAFGVSAD